MARVMRAGLTVTTWACLGAREAGRGSGAWVTACLCRPPPYRCCPLGPRNGMSGLQKEHSGSQGLPEPLL